LICAVFFKKNKRDSQASALSHKAIFARLLYKFCIRTGSPESGHEPVSLYGSTPNALSCSANFSALLRSSSALFRSFMAA